MEGAGGAGDCRSSWSYCGGVICIYDEAAGRAAVFATGGVVELQLCY